MIIVKLNASYTLYVLCLIFMLGYVSPQCLIKSMVLPHLTVAKLFTLSHVLCRQAGE